MLRDLLLGLGFALSVLFGSCLRVERCVFDEV